MRNIDQYPFDQASYRPGSDGSEDRVYSDRYGWWFWDDTWADRQGPFPSEEKARTQLRCTEALAQIIYH